MGVQDPVVHVRVFVCDLKPVLCVFVCKPTEGCVDSACWVYRIS